MEDDVIKLGIENKLLADLLSREPDPWPGWSVVCRSANRSRALKTNHVAFGP